MVLNNNPKSFGPWKKKRNTVKHCIHFDNNKIYCTKEETCYCLPSLEIFQVNFHTCEKKRLIVKRTHGGELTVAIIWYEKGGKKFHFCFIWK